jgi:hypothetical protein
MQDLWRGSVRATCAAAVLVAFASGCPRSRVTSQECATLVEHYFDLKIDEDPSTKTMSDADRAAFRETVRKAAQSDPDVKQATDQCESEISRGEFDCGMRATTSRQWNDCIQ